MEIGTCPYGCNRPTDFGFGSADTFCNPPPDASTDERDGTGG
ncbi:MAG TPA: hypothetical protein VGK52_20155 [Polyangia bacterium]